MQRLPHTTCPDPFHTATGEPDGVQNLHEVGGGWVAIGYECRTCGFQSVRRTVETRLDQIEISCPGCDAIRLDWDDAPQRCTDCRTLNVRVLTIPLWPTIFDELPAFDDMPSARWSWRRVLQELDA